MNNMAHPSTLKFAAVLALVGGAALAQKPVPPPVDPTLSAKLKDLRDMVKDRKQVQDWQAIGLMQSLSKDPTKINPKDCTKIIKALEGVFNAGKVRTGGKAILYRETCDALVKFETDGAKPILKAAEHKRFDDDLQLRAHMLMALGKTKDVKQIDFLLEVTVRSPHDELRAASGQALSNFKHAKVRTQREIVKEIIKAWGSLESKANQAVSNDPNGPQDFGPQNARQTLRIAQGKWVGTLQKLTGLSQSKFMDWQRWQNKNKGWNPPK
ncbi:MAG: hypothetical protein ACI8UD_003933 [Planctomycetota bacterium]|jgi:hypothetical protein